MKISCYQFDVKYKDTKSNLEKASLKISKIKSDLIILPELFTTGYYFDKKSDLVKLSEKIPEGETTQKLIALAKKFNKFIIGGISEIEKGNLYNTAIIIGPEGFIGKHRKVHIPKLENARYPFLQTRFTHSDLCNLNL